MILKFNATLDRDEDGVWVVECPALPGCVRQGQTREEALAVHFNAWFQAFISISCEHLV
jgi:predicted RNase H-like HicB family nuclease